MNDDDLLDMLEQIAARLDRIEQVTPPLAQLAQFDQLAAVAERCEQIGAQLDRIEGEQARINAALSTVGEAAILTYRATGTKTGLPDEVIDAPVMERAVLRAPLTMPVRRDAAKDTERLAAIVAKGAAAIDAEIKALQQQAQATASLAERIRLGHGVYYLNRAKQQYRRVQDRER